MHKAREQGEKWASMENAMEAKKRDEVPEAWKGFLTVVVLLATIIIGSHMGVNATLIGCALVVILSFSQFKEADWIKLIPDDMHSGVGSIGGIAATLGFGAVVRTTPAYQTIIDGVWD